MSSFAWTDESCRTYKWVMSHMWMSQELEVKAEGIARTPSLQKGMKRSTMKRLLQRVTSCCSVLQRVVACCSVSRSLQTPNLQKCMNRSTMKKCDAVWCSPLQRVAARCGVSSLLRELQAYKRVWIGQLWRGVMQFVAAWCNVLQCVAVSYSMLECVKLNMTTPGLQKGVNQSTMNRIVAIWYSVVAACSIAVCCSALQRVATCCSVL